MKNLIAVLFALFLTVTLASGQTSSPFDIALGAGINSTNDRQPVGAAWYTRPATDGSNNLIVTSATFTAGKPTTVEPGYARVVYKQDLFSVAALGTAGVAMGQENVGSIFGGGGWFHVNLSKWIKQPVGVAFIAQAVKSTIAETQPRLLVAVTYKLGGN